MVGHALACPEKAWASGARRDKLKHVLLKSAAEWLLALERYPLSEQDTVCVLVFHQTPAAHAADSQLYQQIRFPRRRQLHF